MIPLYFQDVLNIICKVCGRPVKVYGAGSKGEIFVRCERCCPIDKPLDTADDSG